jgi:hypothetical protein
MSQQDPVLRESIRKDDRKKIRRALSLKFFDVINVSKVAYSVFGISLSTGSTHLFLLSKQLHTSSILQVNVGGKQEGQLIIMRCKIVLQQSHE